MKTATSSRSRPRASSRPRSSTLALAAEARAACNKHTPAQRAAGIKRGMDIIAAGPAGLAAENAALRKALQLHLDFLASLPTGWLGRTCADIGLLNDAYIASRALGMEIR